MYADETESSSPLFYNVGVKTWDILVVGGGIIGLSLSIELRKRGARVLVIERSRPGREASWAAGGMLADCTLETPAALQELALASARLYPEFVHELQDESGVDVDLRDAGAIIFPAPEQLHERPGFALAELLPARLAELEPCLAEASRPAFFLQERSVDPRRLVQAAWKAAVHREVDIVSGSAASEVLVSDGRVSGVKTEKTFYPAPAVVNCAGAWAGSLPPLHFPTVPVKGQMLAIVGAPANVPRHVIRTPEVYIIPRSDGRVVIGATLENAGYDKRTDPETIQCLHQAAVRTLPPLHSGKILEAWAGLRPGTPDALPILGTTSIPGYFLATGHYRDGILLAPVTAAIMGRVVSGCDPGYDISAFSVERLRVA
jgi:glycine oxidase